MTLLDFIADLRFNLCDSVRLTNMVREGGNLACHSVFVFTEAVQGLVQSDELAIVRLGRDRRVMPLLIWIDPTTVLVFGFLAFLALHILLVLAVFSGVLGFHKRSSLGST